MSKNFDDLLSKLRVAETKKLSVAVAQDEPVLEAVKAAKDRGIADAILVGDKSKIKEVAAKIDMDLTDFEIIHEEDIKKATLKAIQLVSSGAADMVMKGLVDTATFLRSVLNKEVGLRTGKLMSHVSVFEIEGIDRLILLTDAAINFSLSPPIGNTLPLSVISPVILISLGITLFLSKLTIALTIEIPAEGPSLGVAPSSICKWKSISQKRL